VTAGPNDGLMSPSGPERAGLLVVRAWTEDGTPSLKARIVYTTDVTRGVQVEKLAATPDEVETAVRTWLAALLTPTG
jgi:hypothetical protein